LELREKTEPAMNGKSPSDDRIERLLRYAGPRPSVPEDRAERVKDAVMRSWRGALRARFRRRVVWWGSLAAAAASLALVLAPRVGLDVDSYLEPLPASPVAHVETLAGVARYAPREARGGLPAQYVLVGDVLETGGTLETGSQSRIALRLNSGPSMRVDRDSSLHFLSPSAVELARGAVYVDSRALGVPIEVHTAAGTVTDVGTQFEVRLQPEGVRVRVREGLVSLERSGKSFAAEAGTELEVDGSGSVARRAVPTFGPPWDWVLDVAPPFTLEGSTLASFLQWVDRETGLGVRFADQRAELAAPSVILHGSLDGLRPDRALDAVLPTCGLTHRLDSGTLYIEALPE
jgi:FecR protein